MNKHDKVYSSIGLAIKAGKVVSGAFGCENAVKNGMACLVIVTQDASINTKKKFEDMCKFYMVDIRIFGKKEILGRYLGKENRSVAAVLDINLSKLIAGAIDNAGNLTGVKDIEEN